ncbi:hypothetical protein F5148DRAFT_1374703 [Russula earlei]|uniref:Uncharacterized protein n=1 Tax=Russula earlei TaxID=71964 RepID=A0ACC0UG48_9AGAM|nr:hypothetical protein F5148DRAFT_1374703 [Russula earlei]
MDINTWRDLLLPDHQDVHVRLRQIHETPVTSVVQMSSFNPLLGNQMRLPASVHLVENLPAMMWEHLGDIINQSYSETAAGTVFLDDEDPITPQSALQQLRRGCRRTSFFANREASSGAIALNLSYLVEDIYRALTNDMLQFLSQEPSLNRMVITDHSYRLNGEVKILWQDKSPHVFNRFMEELMTQLRTPEMSIPIRGSSNKHTGYEAILGKLVYHAGDVSVGSPRHVRWAVVFSGLHYTIMYIPRTPGRPRVYCSPITKFCLPPCDDEGRLPPIWSMLVYMLLTEVRDIDDDTLMQRFRLDVPTEDPSLLPRGRQMTNDRMRSAGLVFKSNRGRSSAGPSNVTTATHASIVIQCLDGLPIEFTLVDAPLSHLAKKTCRHFIHCDHYLGGGWSSVYASRNWHVVVKFAAVPKEDKAMLERQLSNETAAYHKLSRIAGWVVPLHYGEYKWDGGRAIILSDEGRSLSHLETFTSLSFVERLILFGELYSIHLLGVEHGDLEPRNVLRKKWSLLPKIIDFGIADVNHSCPGWSQCKELNDVWRKLGLVDLWLKCRVLEKFKITPVTGRDHHCLLLMIFVFILAVLIMKWTF